MSETTYVPRPGSKAEAAVAALMRSKWLSANDLAAECEVERANLDGNIAVAIREGLIRRVARDGEAGFALGSTGDRPAREDEDDEAAPKRRARPRRKPAAAHPVNSDHAVGVLEDGTIVIVDEQGHAMSLPVTIARRVAELVARTAWPSTHS